MFGFFKKKLHDVVGKFSKKVEDEAKEESLLEKASGKEEKKETKEKKEEKKVKKEKKKEKIHVTYFVHGTTTDNEKGISTGQAQGELSDLGIKQSEELSKNLKEKKFDVIFCSDLKRAIDSAKIIFGNKYNLKKDKRLRECNYGDLNQADEKEVIYSEHIKKPFPNGESLEDVEERIFEFLVFLNKKYSGKHVAIVSHKAPQLALEVLLNKKNWQTAINKDWRKNKSWKPGWDYFIDTELTRPIKTEEKPVEEPKPILEKKAEEEIDKEKLEKEKKELKEEIKEKKSLFAKLKEKVVSKKISEEKFEDLFSDLEMVLLENNVALEVIDKIKESLRMDIVNVPLTNVKKTIEKSLEESLRDLLGFEKIDLFSKIKGKKPFVIMFLGVNGTGKTLSISKVCQMFQDKGLKCVLVAADTFRAASIEQLEEHATRLGVKVIKHSYGSDPAAVAFDGVKHAEAKGIDVVLIDTAGRQHSNQNLIDELKKVNRIAKPDFKIFVGESITGNDCIEQAKSFNNAVGIDGIILSKFDVDDKGGTAISISQVIGKPILYFGVGQRYRDLKEFDREEILKSLGF